MRTILHTFILLLCCSSSFAQKEANIWYFGENAGLDFNNDTVVALVDGKITSDAAGATISDKNGNLLFYTDGVTVWNANHDTMPNGAGLLGDNFGDQPAIIVPQPRNDSLYYIFSVGQPLATNQVSYSVVNMNLDGGFGDIIPGTKNTQLLFPAASKMTAALHANRCDVWFITHEWGSDSFYVYLITDTGISAPLIQEIGRSVSGNIGNTQGQVKVSPNGQKLALATRADRLFDLFDFNNITGMITNPFTLSTNSIFPISLSFSPDNSKLFVTNVSSWDSLYQYDLSVWDSASIQSSKVGFKFPEFGMVQLAPDNKVYRTRWLKDSIGVFMSPNELGLASNYIDTGVYLGGKFCKASLPNFIESYFNPVRPDFTFAFDTVCAGTPIPFTGIHPYNALVWSWNFDDTSSANNTDTSQSPTHVFSDTGVYNVRLIITGACWVDTVIKTIVAIPNTMSVDIGNDTTACYGASVALNAYNPGSAFAWSTGDNTQTIAVDSAGAYYVTVSQQGCSVADTIVISRYPEISVSLGQDTVNCGRDTIVLDAGNAGSAYLWSDGSAGQTLSVAATGTYWVEVSKIGCTVTDTVKIIQSALSAAILNGDTTLFSGGSIQLSGTVTGSTDYTWSPAAGLSCTNCLNPLASPESKTAYMLTATDTNGCVSADTVIIGIDAQSVLFIPDIFSPNNDGSNDLLHVRGKNIKSLKFSVYDRWGEKVFETNDLSVGWDGTYRGQPVNPGVFVYSVTGRFTNGEIINEKGDVTLVR